MGGIYMIHRLQIKGFKCFDDADFSFGNLTLLAGKNSMGKSTVIQAILAMVQDGNNPFMGPYINIGKISELKNKYVGSQKIELTINSTFSKKIFDDKTKVESQGRLSEEVAVMYLSADRIGVRDTYETTAITIGSGCFASNGTTKRATKDNRGSPFPVPFSQPTGRPHTAYCKTFLHIHSLLRTVTEPPVSHPHQALLYPRRTTDMLPHLPPSRPRSQKIQ